MKTDRRRGKAPILVCGKNSFLANKDNVLGMYLAGHDYSWG